MNKNKATKLPNHRFPDDLNGMIRQFKPVSTWKHLSCSQQTLSELKNICGEFIPGKSHVCLFIGESDVDRTKAAEMIANDLNLDLYHIDLTVVVSKYIGETEKNLQRIFQEAETSNAILFFDEADALFGNRTEVKYSHDRHTNIDINYLLQRIEAFPGLSILATNMKHTLDRAYMRHFRYVVNFPSR